MLSTPFGLFYGSLLLVIEDAEVAAPADQFFRRHLGAKRRKGDAEFLGDAELELEPVVFGQLSL